MRDFIENYHEKSEEEQVFPRFRQAAEMDVETRDLALFAALSLVCAGVAWIVDHPIFSSVFFVLGGVAIVGAIETHWR